jgi:hypothetical protein
MPLSIDSLRAFVQGAAKRPGMYMLPISVDQFAGIIYGYEAAMMDEKVVTELPVAHAFSRWLAERWDLPRNVLWQVHVRERYGNGPDAVCEAAKLIEGYLAGERREA